MWRPHSRVAEATLMSCLTSRPTSLRHESHLTSPQVAHHRQQLRSALPACKIASCSKACHESEAFLPRTALFVQTGHSQRGAILFAEGVPEREGSRHLSESTPCLNQSHAGVACDYDLQELVPHKPMRLLLHDCLLPLYRTP